HLPFVRRYARALTGDQAAGDSYVRACLEALREGDDLLPDDLPPRVAFYRAFEAIWRSSGALLETRDPDAEPAGGATTPSERLLRIAPRSRQAFLLTSVEGFTDEEAAVVLSTTTEEIEDLITEAQADIDAELATNVLII